MIRFYFVVPTLAFSISVRAAQTEPKALPELFRTQTIDDRPGRYHLAPIVAHVPGVDTVRMLSLVRPLTQFRPAAGLVSRTTSGYVVHQEHLSGLLRIDAAATTRHASAGRADFDGYAELDVYAHDLHVTGLRFEFATRATARTKGELLARLGFLLTDEWVRPDRLAWDARDERWVYDPDHPMVRDWTLASRFDWQRIPHFERILMTLPNVAAGRLVLYDGRGRPLAESEEVVRTSHLRLGDRKPTSRDPRQWIEPERLRARFDDETIRKTKRVELVYTHHLLPRGRPDAAISRLRALADDLKLEAPLADFETLANDDRELAVVYDFHREDFAREATLQALPRTLRGYDRALEAFGRRLGDLNGLIDRHRRLCEAGLDVERAALRATIDRFSSFLGGGRPYEFATSETEARARLEKIRREH